MLFDEQVFGNIYVAFTARASTVSEKKKSDSQACARYHEAFSSIFFFANKRLVGLRERGGGRTV